MDKYSKRAIRIVRVLALIIIAIGFLMMMINSSATGMVGGGKFTSGNYASLTGFQITVVGVIMFLITLLFIERKSKQ